jgi:hypothetical protein
MSDTDVYSTSRFVRFPNTCLLVPALAAVALPACLGTSDGGAPGHEIVAAGFQTTKDLISPANCTLSQGRLRNCVFPPTRWTPTLFPTAVPLRTKVLTTVMGNCSTQFPLEVTFQVPGLPDTPMPFLANRTLKLRRAAGLAFDDVTFIDLSPWTATASFDQSCRVALQITFNDLDVDSNNDAVAILARLEHELADKTRLRDRAIQLLGFANAFDFIQELLGSFHQELTNDQMRDLRQLSIDNSDVLAELIGSCDVVGPNGEHFPTDEQRQGLTDLFLALGTLGDPEVWNHPNGSPITIAEFMGPEQAQIVATLNAILDATEGTNPAVYAAEAEVASAAVADVAVRIALAQQQLAEWL